MTQRSLLVGIAALLIGSLALAADWPQWRGPDRTGISKETGLLKNWPDEGPPLQWSYKNAGLGFSSFAVVDGVLYTLGTRDKDEVVLALDADQGTELWTAKVAPIFTFDGNVWGDGPRGTPTIDGKYLYALGGQGELVCLDISAKGKEIWRLNLMKDLGGEMMDSGDPRDYGYSESPLVDGKLLIVTPGGPKGTLAALDKTTGKVVWRSTELTQGAPYSSVVVAEIHGVRQYIQNGYIDEKQGGFLNGVRAEDGKLLWSENLFKKRSYSIGPMPVVKDNLVYITTGWGGGSHLFEISKDMQAKNLYSKRAQRNMKNRDGGVVLLDEHIYGHSEGQGWVCQEFKSGDVAWLERNDLLSQSGAIISAEGMLYLYTDEGEVGLVEADPEEFKLVSQFKIPETSKYPGTLATSRQSKVWAHPVIANGRLFLRDAELIFCYDIRAKK